MSIMIRYHRQVLLFVNFSESLLSSDLTDHSQWSQTIINSFWSPLIDAESISSRSTLELYAATVVIHSLFMTLSNQTRACLILVVIGCIWKRQAVPCSSRRTLRKASNTWKSVMEDIRYMLHKASARHVAPRSDNII